MKHQNFVANCRGRDNSSPKRLLDSEALFDVVAKAHTPKKNHTRKVYHKLYSLDRNKKKSNEPQILLFFLFFIIAFYSRFGSFAHPEKKIIECDVVMSLKGEGILEFLF
jgi:CRISPR/Cas system CSM-associated protein Csm2 small subunit